MLLAFDTSASFADKYLGHTRQFAASRAKDVLSARNMPHAGEFQVLAPSIVLNPGLAALGSRENAEFVLACWQFVQPNSNPHVVIWPQFFRPGRGLPSSSPPESGH
jgi:hypothetical protein